MKKTEKVIMYDSPEAAQLVHLNFPDGTAYGKGWVSLNRRFYPVEEQARADSATHRKCECGETIRMYSYCESCSTKKARDSYSKMPFKEYDGSYLVLHNDDKYFSDEDEVREHCADNGIMPEDLMLVICEPNYLNQIDEGYWEDVMPEDGDGELPKEAKQAMDAFNEVLKKQAPVSYSAGRYRTAISNIEVVTDLQFEHGNG